jgi:hypothetical protein
MRELIAWFVCYLCYYHYFIGECEVEDERTENGSTCGPIRCSADGPSPTDAPPSDAPGPGTTTSAPMSVTDGGDPPIVTDEAPASSPAPAPTLAPIDSDSDSAKWNHPSVVVGLLWMTVWTVIAKMMNTS